MGPTLKTNVLVAQTVVTFQMKTILGVLPDGNLVSKKNYGRSIDNLTGEVNSLIAREINSLVTKIKFREPLLVRLPNRCCHRFKPLYAILIILVKRSSRNDSLNAPELNIGQEESHYTTSGL